MDKNFPNRIRYEYKHDPEASPNYAHGVFGGINTQGEIELIFYMESDKLPPFSERLVAPDGSFGHEMVPYDEEMRVISRHIHSRIIVNYHTARALLEWLEDKVETLDMEEGASPLMVDGDTGIEQ